MGGKGGRSRNLTLDRTGDWPYKEKKLSVIGQLKSRDGRNGSRQRPNFVKQVFHECRQKPIKPQQGRKREFTWFLNLAIDVPQGMQMKMAVTEERKKRKLLKYLSCSMKQLRGG